MAFRHDAGDLTPAFHRCVGVGKCRIETATTDGFMCPSYQATRDEKDSTRGRARVLQEAVNGTLVLGGLPAAEVAESLELCLSCKACSSDCPAGVDMAMYKSEVLYRTFRVGLRPRSHYALGWLPRWLGLPTPLPALVNRSRRRLGCARWCSPLPGSMRAGPCRRWRGARSWLARRRSGAGAHRTPTGPACVLWVDSFSNGFDPVVASAAADVLQAAGYHVTCRRIRCVADSPGSRPGSSTVPRRRLRHCSTYSTGSGPGRADRRTGAAVRGASCAPTCSSCSRRSTVSAGCPSGRHLAELLDRSHLRGTTGAPRPVADPRRGTAALPSARGDGLRRRAALARGVRSRRGGADGLLRLAGNFGMERGHYEVSVAIAENALLPALRSNPDAVLLADGFSCRTQAADLAGATGVHLAQLLATAARTTTMG